MSNVTTLFVGNATVLEVRGLKDEVDGGYLGAATVTATLVDSTGAQVAGQTWPATLAYVAGSDGTYRGTLSHALALVAGGSYTAQISANGGAGLEGSWAIPCVARTRQE